MHLQKKRFPSVRITASHQLNRHRNESHEEKQKQTRRSAAQSGLPHQTRLAHDAPFRAQFVRNRQFFFPEIQFVLAFAFAVFEGVRCEFECARVPCFRVFNGRRHFLVQWRVCVSFCVRLANSCQTKFFERVCFSFVLDSCATDQNRNSGLAAADAAGLRRPPPKFFRVQPGRFHYLLLGAHLLLVLPRECF